jgi:hypothetical protein
MCGECIEAWKIKDAASLAKIRDEKLWKRSRRLDAP